MKYLLLIITLLLSSPSWGETVSSGDVVINPTDGLVYKKFTTEPFTGSFMDLDILLKGSYKKGRAHGVWARFYENGLVLTKTNFKDGIKDGFWEEYYDNGQLKERITYKDGKRSGLFQYFGKDGTIKSSATYKNGKKVTD